MRAAATALLVAVFTFASVAAQDIPLNNWSVPQQSSRGHVGSNGDVFDRYLVRVEEMHQSARIIRQALANLPDGSESTSPENRGLVSLT